MLHYCAGASSSEPGQICWTPHDSSVGSTDVSPTGACCVGATSAAKLTCWNHRQGARSRRSLYQSRGCTMLWLQPVLAAIELGCLRRWPKAQWVADMIVANRGACSTIRGRWNHRLVVAGLVALMQCNHSEHCRLSDNEPRACSWSRSTVTLSCCALRSVANMNC